MNEIVCAIFPILPLAPITVSAIVRQRVRPCLAPRNGVIGPEFVAENHRDLTHDPRIDVRKLQSYLAVVS